MDEVKAEFEMDNYQIVWDASSALDMYPFYALHMGYFPVKNRSDIENPVVIMSDYGPKHMNSIKEAYDNLDYGSVKLNKDDTYYRFRIYSNDFDGDNQFNIFLDQMIPLKLWDKPQIYEFNSLYHSSQFADSAIYDREWQVVFMILRTVGRYEEKEYPVFFISTENLLVFRNIFKKYELPIEMFFAARVAGKSDSWDATHNLYSGILPREIQSYKKELRPKYWGADYPKWSHGIPKSFNKLGLIKGYGFNCTLFYTNWR